MRNAFKFTIKLFSKVIAFILLAVLSVFNTLLKVTAVIFHYFSFPIIAFGILFSVVTLFDNGFELSTFSSCLTLIMIGILFYILPLLSNYADKFLSTVKNYVFSPLAVKSPVKYTM